MEFNDFIIDDVSVGDPDFQQLIEEVAYRFDCYYKAPTPMAQAHQLRRLADAVSDLKTWHKGFDVGSGTMPADREDND